MEKSFDLLVEAFRQFQVSQIEKNQFLHENIQQTQDQIQLLKDSLQTILEDIEKLKKHCKFPKNPETPTKSLSVKSRIFGTRERTHDDKKQNFVEPEPVSARGPDTRLKREGLKARKERPEKQEKVEDDVPKKVKSVGILRLAVENLGEPTLDSPRNIFNIGRKRANERPSVPETTPRTPRLQEEKQRKGDSKTPSTENSMSSEHRSKLEKHRKTKERRSYVPGEEERKEALESNNGPERVAFSKGRSHSEEKEHHVLLKKTNSGEVLPLLIRGETTTNAVPKRKINIESDPIQVKPRRRKASVPMDGREIFGLKKREKIQFLPSEIQDHSHKGLADLPPELFEGRLNTTLKLCLQHNQLSTLPDEIGTFQHLRVLDVSHNGLLILPSTIGDLVHLRSLNLSGNPYIKLSPEITRLSQLETIRLNHNLFLEMPDELFHLHNLRKIYLSNNSIFKISPLISDLTRLEVLDMGHNKLTEIPSSLDPCTSLTKLIFRYNNLNTISDGLVKLTNLVKLDVLHNNLLGLPPKFILRTMQKLESLIIQHNKIEHFPYDFFRRAVNFKKLLAGNNRLTSIPGSLSNCTSLTKIDLQNNQIPLLPNLSRLQNLKTLLLSHNLLSKNIEGLQHCISLETLNLSSNQLVQTKELGLENYGKLRNLFLSNNQFEELSDIASPTVEILSLSSNPLINPPQISLFPNVQAVFLNNLQLAQIPDSLFSLHTLVHLDVSRNQIKELPDDVPALPHLKVMDLSHNEIVNSEKEWEGVDWWCHFECLAFIDLSWNRLHKIPLGISKLIEERFIDVNLDKCQLAEVKERDLGVFNIGYSEMIAIGQSRQDFFLINNALETRIGIFGLFDGHINPDAARYASEHFSDHLCKYIEEFQDPLKALKKTHNLVYTNWNNVKKYKKVKQETPTKEESFVGVVVVLYQNNLYVANFGDFKTRAVLYRGGSDWTPGNDSSSLVPYLQSINNEILPESERVKGEYYYCVLPQEPDAFLVLSSAVVWEKINHHQAIATIHDKIYFQKKDLHLAAMSLRDYIVTMATNTNINTFIIKW